MTKIYSLFKGLVEALSFRMKHEMRPFNLHSTSQIEKILADGLYAIFHKSWLEYFHEDQILVVNGNNFREFLADLTLYI